MNLFDPTEELQATHDNQLMQELTETMNQMKGTDTPGYPVEEDPHGLTRAADTINS